MLRTFPAQIVPDPNQPNPMQARTRLTRNHTTRTTRPQRGTLAGDADAGRPWLHPGWGQEDRPASESRNGLCKGRQDEVTKATHRQGIRREPERFTHRTLLRSPLRSPLEGLGREPGPKPQDWVNCAPDLDRTRAGQASLAEAEDKAGRATPTVPGRVRPPPSRARSRPSKAAEGI